MVAPRAVARFNRKVTNRVLGRVADRAPGFGVVLHRGRRSGRAYRTPVNIFAIPTGYSIALTYGRDVDWLRNVLAAGGCQVVTRGRTLDLHAPEVVHDPQLRDVPALTRPILRLLRVTDFLHLTPTPGHPPNRR
jgi:deazaflavin-dependent oxidoreductase (nitroreductase family)